MQHASRRVSFQHGLRKPRVYDTPAPEGIFPQKEAYTYEDYASLPEGAPYQLIGGQLIMTPSPMPYHQEVLRKLGFKILFFMEQTGKQGHLYYAPLDVYFSDSEVYQPDILYIQKEREGIIGETKVEGSPDVIMEILSPSTAYYDLRNKFKTYEKYGVSEYWIVDPGQRRIEIYENQGQKFVLYMEAEGEGSVSSKVIEGFRVTLQDVC